MDRIERLREVLGKYPQVVFLAIIGSLAKRGYTVHDVDIAVKVCDKERKYDILAELVAEIATVLGVPEELIDVVDLDRADLEIKAAILRNSIVIVDKGYLSKLVEEIEKIYPEHSEYRDLSIAEWLLSSDPTTVDVNIVKRRLDFVRSETSFLKEHVLNKSLEEVKSSPILSRVLERSYQLIVEALINVARHIVSAMGWGPCFTASEYIYSEYIYRLAQHSVIPKELADEIAKRIRLRNIIVHRYLEVDYDELYNDAHRLVEIAKSFEKHVVEFIKKMVKETR